MLEYFYYIVWASPVVVPIIAAVNSDKNWRMANAGLAAFGSSIFVAIFSIPVAVNYSSTAQYQGIIKAQQPIVGHYELFVEDLNKQLQEIKGQEAFTMTHDTPVASLTEAKLDAQIKLLNARKAADVARLEIEKIRFGLLGFVVKWVEAKR